MPFLASRADFVDVVNWQGLKTLASAVKHVRAAQPLTMTAPNNTLNSHVPTHHSHKHDNCKAVFQIDVETALHSLCGFGAQRDNFD